MGRIGVLGGGQLAWMMAQAAPRLGLELWVQAPSEADPAVALAAGRILAPPEDAVATAQLAQHCQVITFENEFVHLEALRNLEAQGVCFRPQLASLAPLLDKYTQRCFLRDLGLPVPEFRLLTATEQPQSYPVVLKACRGGYDGLGTRILHTPAALDQIRQEWAGRPAVVEAFVTYERELAILAARDVAGQIVHYPLVETQQEDQVCRRVLVPAAVPDEVTLQAEAMATTLLLALDYVGLLAIEFFLTPEGKLLVNEIAPRTHNSGHYTLDACVTSQFEQHLRATAGRPLGPPDLQVPAAVMVNLLGYETGERDYQATLKALADLPHSHVYWYGKNQARPGRKMGHVTVCLEQFDPTLAWAQARQIEALWVQ
ncbi:MAG: 5-(carboxyamino)imidazole ribonucleotide synthase [Gloeomargaritaceae cyanobacterium C42_A2020_066]|nr:5-(carboxyamino)imidazole ribonucleotide synthase [Gloeomargaritaceae cyanobacterium C42_A2020_066]